MSANVWRAIAIGLAVILLIALVAAYVGLGKPASVQQIALLGHCAQRGFREGCSSGPGTPLHVAGADCGECHRLEHRVWALSLHAASPAQVLLNTEHDKTELLINECIGCHAPFQAKAFKIGDFVQPLNQQGPWHLVQANVDQWQAIKCEVCHDMKSKAPFMLAFYDGTKGAYLQVASVTALCEQCHKAGTDDSRDLKGSVHEGLQCVACHLRNGMNINPRGSCGLCHPKVDPKGQPPVATLDTTYKNVKSKNNIHFISCKSCHPKGIPRPRR